MFSLLVFFCLLTCGTTCRVFAEGSILSPSAPLDQGDSDSNAMESTYGDDSGTGEVDEDIIIQENVNTNEDEGVTEG